MARHIFKSTKQVIFNKRVFGFDIETYDRNTKITCISIVGKDEKGCIYQRYFENCNGRDVKKEFIDEILNNPIFENSVIFATNLDFDFLGIFFGEDVQRHFHPIRRGTKLLAMKTYKIKKGYKSKENRFSFFSKDQSSKTKANRPTIEFRDSLNYAQMSVENMGKTIGFEKLPMPDFIEDKELWTKPKSFDDWEQMKRYNLNDSWVTYKFMIYLLQGYQDLGASVRLTQASTSMSLFKNRFLGDFVLHPQPKEQLLNIMKAYYGGRTEAFKRGNFKNCKYYDFNSLYPSVMHDYEFPDPNSMRYTQRDVPNYIEHCEGVSEVTIEVPKMNIPPLPYKIKKQILFPYGTLKGWWSHIEIRNAIECGCTLKKVHQCIYFIRKIRPFQGFVKTLYELRQQYKKNHNKMEYVTKILMNSLYGKFGEKFGERTETFYKDSVTPEMMSEAIKVEYIGDDWVDLTTISEPMAHCIPIWAVYVSAYGRVKLHQTMMKHPDVIYCDTDSLITHDTIPASNRLGDLKLEHNVSEGWVVRPKMYCFIDDESKEEQVKLKGLGMRIDIARFLGLEDDPKILYKRIAKFKEAIRRGYFVPNETIPTHKTFSLEDTKRDWGEQKFSFKAFQESDPIEIIEGEIVRKMDKTSQGRKLESQEEANDK